jgi:hypothetical protein
LYILIFFIKGSLPWQNLKAGKRVDKYNKIFEVKLLTPLEELASGLPMAIRELLFSTRMMEYE